MAFYILRKFEETRSIESLGFGIFVVKNRVINKSIE